MELIIRNIIRDSSDNKLVSIEWEASKSGKTTRSAIGIDKILEANTSVNDEIYADNLAADIIKQWLSNTLDLVEIEASLIERINESEKTNTLKENNK
jgi:hypothetical protein